MAGVIQLKRRIPGTGKPASGTAADQVRIGELATSISTIGSTGIANLYIGDGSFVHDLVSAQRQVELYGDQIINGDKIFGGDTTFNGDTVFAGDTIFNAGAEITLTNLADLTLPGGNPDDILSTDGAGNLSWIELPKGVTTGTTQPTGPSEPGDVWFDTTPPAQLKVYNGTAWVSVAGNYLPLIGGILSGALTGTAATFTGLTVPSVTSTGNLTLSTPVGSNVLLPHDPTVALGAATRQYVDAQIGTASAITAFSATETYAVGDFVIHGGHLWRAHAANGPAAWSATNWDQIATEADLDAYLPLTGGILSGGVTGTTLGLSGAITTTGVTSTGNLTLTAPAANNILLPHAPTVDMGAANKKYVDDELDLLEQQIAAVAGALRFVGNYNANISQVVTAATGTLTAGANLPAPSAPPAANANEGWYVIVTVAGTPVAPAPNVPMQAGDWIVSTGTQWIHVPLYHTAVTAANVAITTINAQTWTTVQQALGGIYTMMTTAGNAAVLTDGVSILGDGTDITPLTATEGSLRIGVIDGGTY